ncbi:MAG TPA: type II toxin-antitoxin system VapC family toxin, partial [Acidimicrobiales bacterium]|nr:type II toxin-antitoxin system VapC family toxin [Acidimicrobiales bacterium]
RVRPRRRTAALIAYFDTSAIVPLLVDEGGTIAARDIWLAADRLVSVRLARVEARAALAQAARTARISAEQLRSSTQELEGLFVQLDLVDVDDSLIRHAADLTEAQALRAYDAVHLAAAMQVVEADLVLVAGDRALLTAAESLGLMVATIG